MLSDNSFPVLGKTGSCRFVKWDKLDNKQAIRVHSQTLERLAERGGLAWEELYMNYYKVDYFSNLVIDKKLFKEMVDDIAC